jgi:hypothetical protein
LDCRGQRGGERQAVFVPLLRVLADRVVADRDDRLPEVGGGACREPAVAPVGAVVVDRGVAEPQVREVDHAHDRAAVVDQAEGDGAQRKSAQEVRGAVDGVERPEGVCFRRRHRAAAAFLAEETDVRCLVLEELLDGVFDRNVQRGDHVPVTFPGDRSGGLLFDH